MNEKSENINELVKAVCEAQKDIRHATKDSTNPHFKSHYASLTSVIEASREGLNKNGLAIFQVSSIENGEPALDTLLAHVSGQWIKARYLLRPDKPTPQGYGSALSYARRYSLLSILNLSAEDDDGNAATDSHNTALNGSKTRNSPTPKAAPEPLSEKQIVRLFAIAKESHWSHKDLKEYLRSLGLESTKELTWIQYEHMTQLMKKFPKEPEPIAHHQV